MFKRSNVLRFMVFSWFYFFIYSKMSRRAPCDQWRTRRPEWLFLRVLEGKMFRLSLLLYGNGILRRCHLSSPVLDMKMKTRVTRIPPWRTPLLTLVAFDFAWFTLRLIVGSVSNIAHSTPRFTGYCQLARFMCSGSVTTLLHVFLRSLWITALFCSVLWSGSEVK